MGRQQRGSVPRVVAARPLTRPGGNRGVALKQRRGGIHTHDKGGKQSVGERELAHNDNTNNKNNK